MKFRVIIEPDLDDGGFVVSCPSLPGCHSQGDTLEEALANIQEAIALYIESLKAHGEPVPAEFEVEVPV
jgi:predicted RNase H-like HicB family nuclease